MKRGANSVIRVLVSGPKKIRMNESYVTNKKKIYNFNCLTDCHSLSSYQSQKFRFDITKHFTNTHS